MKALVENDFFNAAKRLNCDVAAIKAVAEVESSGYGFQNDGKPKILYETHYFHRLTGGKFSKNYPNLSNPIYGGYGNAASQHSRLEKAALLNRDAALMSCSWGKFQIMGEHWRKFGYESLQEFINKMYESEASQLDAFVRYILVFGLKKYIQQKNWKAFALAYNGKLYYKNKYDTKMAEAYKKHQNREKTSSIK